MIIGLVPMYWYQSSFRLFQLNDSIFKTKEVYIFQKHTMSICVM